MLDIQQIKREKFSIEKFSNIFSLVDPHTVRNGFKMQLSVTINIHFIQTFQTEFLLSTQNISQGNQDDGEPWDQQWQSAILMKAEQKSDQTTQAFKANIKHSDLFFNCSWKGLTVFSREVTFLWRRTDGLMKSDTKWCFSAFLGESQKRRYNPKIRNRPRDQRWVLWYPRSIGRLLSLELSGQWCWLAQSPD